MIIAIPNKGNMVNQHFGRSESFVIVAIEDKKTVAIQEISAVQFAHQHEGLADLLSQHGVTVAIVGGIGGGAISGLQQNGIEIIKGASGEYKQVIEEYINGTLEDKDVTCNHHGEHHSH
jgi:predicted Fe-Mo cluster-binding NifX family protein